MKKLYKILILIGFPFLLNACFSLDQEPYKELGQKSSFQSLQDAQFWVNGMYATLRSNVYGRAMYATDAQSDFVNLARRSSNNDVLTELHNWTLLTSSNEVIATIWQNYFGAIQNINIGLEGIPTIPISAQGAAAATKQINQNMGELYLARAYYYTYLATHYCPAYDENSVYGLPLLDKPTVNDFPARSSVKETYDFILADIARAEQLLSNITGSAGKATFSKDAVAALKARVLLYKKDWAGAYQTASQLISAGTYPLTTTSSTLQNVWEKDGSAETITRLYARYDKGNVAELPNGNDVYLGEEKSYYTQKVLYYYPKLIPTQSFVDLFNNADLRKNMYIKKLFANYASTKYDNVYLVYKYPDNDELKSSSKDEATYLHRPKVFRIAELYLIAAEAAYKNGDETNAKIYLDRLRSARGIGSVAYTDLWTEIQNERNRELAFEGFRIADIKRWELGVVRGTPQNVNAIVSDPADQYHQLNVPAGDSKLYKLTWPIPPNNIRYENGKWAQNPGW